MRASLSVMFFFVLSGCDAPVFDAATLTAQPAALSACAPPAVVRLSWDARASGQQDVDLYFRQRGTELHFGVGGPEGSVETGPWIRPNTEFILRSRDGR